MPAVSSASLLASRRESFRMQDGASEGTHAVTDEHESFFARGRDFEAVGDAHSYTEQEKELLNSFESINYLPPNNMIYRNYLSVDDFWTGGCTGRQDVTT